MHVLEDHPELIELIDEVMGVVPDPEVITPDRDRGRWRYWKTGVGPSRWLFVVVEWRTPIPYLVTAFGKRKGPS